MSEIFVFLVLVAVVSVVLVFVITLPDPRRGPLTGRAEALVRYAAGAAIAALTTSLMYIAEESTGSVPALAVGDGMMVLAAWLVWTALSAVNGRGRVAPFVAVAVAALSTVVSLLIPEVASTAVKLVLVGLGCLAIGVESLLGLVHRTMGAGYFTGVGFGFGGYTLVRVVVIAGPGTGSVIYERAFTTIASTLLSVLSIAAVTTGIVLMSRRLTPKPSLDSTPAMVLALARQVLAHGRAISVYRMDVPDVLLIRRAHGAAGWQTLRDSLVEAASTRFPSGAFAVTPDAGRLVVVEAERKGAPSAETDLQRGFEAAIDRAGLGDLAEVIVTRDFARTPEELERALQSLQTATESDASVGSAS